MARRLGIIFTVVAALLLAVIAYWLLFTTFMAYDDEGYVLISLKNYSAHGGLYAHVFSQYGPFLYVLHDVGHRLLGYEFTNTTGRLITLICWLIVAVGSAHLVWRQTRALTLTGFTLGLTFFHLWLMVSEPIHPGGLIAALITLGAWLGSHCIERRKMRSLAITAGLLGTALLLTKINVGIFFLIAAAAWFVVQLREMPQSRAATLTMAAGLVLLPVGLMHTQLSESWSQIFAELSVVSSLSMLAAAWRDRQPLTTWKHGGWGGGAVVLFGVTIIAAVFFRGTALSDLLSGILLDPLRHPGVYHFPPAWKPGAQIIGVISLLLAILVCTVQAARLSWIIIGLRLTVIALFGLASAEVLPITSHSFTMSYAVPLAWIFAVELAPDRATDQPSVRTWLGLLLVLQYLHAFPVAGSQVAWGTFLIVPLMALSLQDTQRFFAARNLFSPGATSLGLAALALAMGSTARLGVMGWHRYSESQPLRLPGAENIRLPEGFSSALRVLALNATAHGDMLFSFPGMYSFNGWTDLPTPTLTNTTHWFSLLNQPQQDEIADALSQSKRPVVIMQRGVIGFLQANNFPLRSRLSDYLNANFEKVFSLENFEFWVRRTRIITPLATAELRQLKAAQPGLYPAQLELVVALPRASRIAYLELATLEENPRILAHWDQSTGPLLSTGISLQGAPLTSAFGEGWNQKLPSLARLILPLAKHLSLNRATSVIYLRDNRGELLAECRFIE